MDAKKAYRDFIDALLVWLPEQAGDDECLQFMIRGAKPHCNNGYVHIVSFPSPTGGRRKADLCFAQNISTGDRSSKVFCVELGIGSKLTYGWLEAEAMRMLPADTICGTYDRKGRKIFYAQTEWGREGEWDRLYSPPTRPRLFQFAFAALRFARHALEHEASLACGV